VAEEIEQGFIMFFDQNDGNNSNEQSWSTARQDFSHAYRKGFFHAIVAWIQHLNNDLIPYDEVRKRIPMRGQHYLGLQQIETDKIVGSVSRFNDFDRAFLPRQTHTRSRWESIDRAYFQDVILPPIDVYKIGDVYFVKDGNHRVSVAKERGQAYMDAYVVEMNIPGTLGEDSSILRTWMSITPTRISSSPSPGNTTNYCSTSLSTSGSWAKRSSIPSSMKPPSRGGIETCINRWSRSSASTRFSRNSPAAPRLISTFGSLSTAGTLVKKDAGRSAWKQLHSTLAGSFHVCLSGTPGR
jgi:hypothetical protein